MGKGQSSIELIVLFSVVMFFFTALILVYFDKQETVNDLQETLEMRMLAHGLARQLNSALAAGNGSNATITIPRWLSRGQTACYEINGTKRVALVYLRISASPLVYGKTVAAPIATSSVQSLALCDQSGPSILNFSNNNSASIRISYTVVT